MPTTWDAAYDLMLELSNGNHIGLMVAPDKHGRKRLPGAWTPSDASTAFSDQDVPRTYGDCSAGAGYSMADPRVPNGYAYALGVHTRTPGVVLPGGARTSVPLSFSGVTLGPILAHFVVGTDLYFVAGRHLLRVPAGYQAPVHVADLAAGMSVPDWVGQSATEHAGAWYIGGVRSAGPERPLVKYDGGTLSYANVVYPADRADAWMLTGNRYQLDAAGTGNLRMFASTAGGTSYKYLTGSADALRASNWTPASGTAGADGDRVGSANFPIRGWNHTNQRVWARKADGVFEATRAGTRIVNLTPYYEARPSADSGTDHLPNGGHFMNGGLLISDGVRGMDWITRLDGQRNDTPTQVGFGMDLPYSGPVGGRTEVITDDGSGWYVAWLYNSSNRTSYGCYGRPRSEIPGQPGLTTFVWHGAELVLPADRKVTDAVTVAPFGNPRMYVASVGTGAGNSGTVYLDWFSLPRDGNPLNDLLWGGPHRFATDSYIYFPDDPWGDPAALKTTRRISMVTRRTSQVSYVDAALSADGGEFTSVGVPTTSPPYETSGIVAPQTARFLQTRVRLVGTATAPPLLHAVKIRAGVYVEPYAVQQVTVVFGEGVRLNNGGWSDDDPVATWNQLVAQAAQGPCTLWTWDGERLTVQIEQRASWVLEKQKTPQGSTRTAVLTLTTLSRAARYGDGSLYGTGVEWGA